MPKVPLVPIRLDYLHNVGVDYTPFAEAICSTAASKSRAHERAAKNHIHDPVGRRELESLLPPMTAEEAALLP